jgi:hypothetical protein
MMQSTRIEASLIGGNPMSQSPVEVGRVRQLRRRLSGHGAAALLAMLAPAIFFPIGLLMLRGEPRFAWLDHVADYPWELWGIAGCGSVATLGGVADWLFHRSGETTVSRKEHRAHLAALTGGGLPVFLLMAAASLHPRPASFLVPVFLMVIVTVILISYDEFVFHRRCGRLESFFHRLLTIGNALAFLAWVHWCFVRGGSHG